MRSSSPCTPSRRGGYEVPVAALVINLRRPGDDEPLRAVRAALVGDRAIDAVKLLLWGAEVIARDAGIVDSED
jgi:hypothetical protein